ncbi:hypothetical protein CBM2618_A180033 [Cupriavidus taiwanensis]|nr:hypothetical protein CBM2591_A230027 [Cupriavidus taiwanensis]SOZ78818.1 hypothetical protein CBM2618_A180033 [Cupriavidus taiwanensis]SOZ79095.1 hypothetical protein CBM2622_A170032 [Cupriavidus taiwanensis]SOZ86340.1 hypothetical protein CBM2621_A170033 [Cupriavidus taiwanensis]
MSQTHCGFTLQLRQSFFETLQRNLSGVRIPN